MKPWRDPLVWLAAVFIAGGLLGGAVLIARLTRPVHAPRRLPAVLTVLPAPTAPPTSAVPTPTPTNTPTALPPPQPQSGVIKIGATVQVRGTGGDGLRFRTEPGLKAPIVFLGRENEVFRVTDGPVAKDGYTWWKMVSVKDKKRFGWAVSNYLALLATPTPSASP